MPIKPADNSMVSEYGNWNIADRFVEKKIMQPLILCDYYEDIAYFGYESIADEIVNYKSIPNDIIRIKAIKRLVKELIRLIDNAKFALRKKGTKEEILEYKEGLIKIENLIPRITKVTHDYVNGTHSIKITNYDLFEEVLNKISQIKSKINEPLNRNDLIFTTKEEFDPHAYKEQLKKSMIERG